MLPMNDDIWRDAVFCLLSPDCVRRHLTRTVLDRFHTIALRPSGWRYVRVTGRQLDTVAEIQRAGAGQTFRYRALDALFTLGPALALRLDDIEGSAPRSADERYRAANEIKGASSPHDATPGTIRHDLGAINTVLSLLHVSDSPVNAALESQAILGPDGMRPSFWPADGLDEFIEILERTHPPEPRDYSDVLAAVRARVIAVLWCDLSSDGQRLADTLARRRELAEPTAGQRVADALDPSAKGHPLADVLRMPFDSSGPLVDTPELQRLLLVHGCGMDAWEYAVLCTSVYFEPVRTANQVHKKGES